jgi:hypothetical protein
MFGMFQSLSTEGEFDLTLLLYSGDCLCRLVRLRTVNDNIVAGNSSSCTVAPRKKIERFVPFLYWYQNVSQTDFSEFYAEPELVVKIGRARAED